MKLTHTIDLTEDKKGFYLYDETRGMNLAMYAKTERDAFIQALEYYQDRMREVEADLKKLQQAVDVFMATITNDN